MLWTEQTTRRFPTVEVPPRDGHDVVELDAPRRAAHSAAREGPLTLALVADEDLAPHGSRDVARILRGRRRRGARLLHEAALPVPRGEEEVEARLEDGLDAR